MLDQNQISNDLLASLLQTSFAQYCIAQAPLALCENFEIGPHHAHIIKICERVDRGELKRVMFFVPPQNGKSLLISRLFPAWYLGRHPNNSIISASYGQEFANGFGRVVRNLVSSPAHTLAFPDCQMSDDSSAQHHFATTRGGEYFAVGRGSPITGRGGNIIIIDDPLKDRKEASSNTTRTQLKEWYSSVIRTRQRKDAAIILVMTRWHVDDLAGWIRREHTHEDWTVIEFPAIAEETDTLGRHPGEALWPSHYPLEWLDSQRKTMTTNEWLSLYQQRPSIGSGYLFKREWLEEHVFDASQHQPPWQSMNRAILVDPANSEKTDSDYTYMWVVGASEDHQYYILDIVRDHFTLVERGNKLFELHKKWKHPGVVGYEQYGMQADISYLTERMDRDFYHFSITPVAGQVSKPDRIERLEPLFREGRIWFPNELMYRGKSGINEDLVKTFIEEEYVNYVAGGGGVKHDDGLDALSRIFDVPLTFPTPSMLGYAYRAFNKARAERRSRVSPWAA